MAGRDEEGGGALPLRQQDRVRPPLAAHGHGRPPLRTKPSPPPPHLRHTRVKVPLGVRTVFVWLPTFATNTQAHRGRQTRKSQTKHALPN